MSQAALHTGRFCRRKLLRAAPLLLLVQSCQRCFACKNFLFRKEKRPLRGRGRGSESPPLHPLKNPHNPRRHKLRGEQSSACGRCNPLRCSALSHGKLASLPLSMGPIRRVLNRRTPVRLYLSPSARCAKGRRSI